MNHNDRGTICQNAFIVSTCFFSFQKFIFLLYRKTCCHTHRVVRARAGREFQPTSLL